MSRMKSMTPGARALLEEYRRHDRPGDEALARIAAGLERKLAMHEPVPPSVDVPPIVLPGASRLDRWHLFWAGTSRFILLGVIAVLGAGAGLFVDRMSGDTSMPPPPASAPSARTPARTPAGEPSPATPQLVAEPTEAKASQATPNTATNGESAALPQRRIELHGSGRPHSTAAKRRAVVSRAAAAPVAIPAPALSPTTQVVASVANTSNAGIGQDLKRPDTSRSLAAAPDAAGSSLEEELKLVRHAYTELNAGRPSAALAILAQHAHKFPHGALEENREVTGVLALCALGEEAAARARARLFLVSHPKSALARRAERPCAR